jgi:alpha-L-fucosidase
VKYAQLLNDASEIKMREAASDVHVGLNEKSPENALTLELPIIKPKVTVPVIELFLK